MPTYRKLHNKVRFSQDFNAMPSDFVRLLWLMLPLVCSRDGTCIYSARYLVGELFPLRMDVTEQDVADALTWLVDRGMLRPYENGGMMYFCIPTFTTYQGDTSREGESPFPRPTPDQLASNSRPAHDQLASNSRPQVDAYVDAQVDASPAAPVVARPTYRPAPFPHDTVPENESLRLLHQAFQRGTGQAETQALPTGGTKAALRQLLDDDRSPDDIEACARYLKSGWWSDKALTVQKLAEQLGQWIAQGRPRKANGNGKTALARASPKVNAAGLTYDEFQQRLIRGEIPDGSEWHAVEVT